MPHRPSNDHPFAAAEDNLDHHQEKADILDMRRRGLSIADISAATGLSRETVGRRLKDMADEARERHQDTADEMFMLHQVRLEALFAVVQRQIDDMAVFDDKIFRAAVMLLERQSRLLGLDRSDKSDDRRNKNDWIEAATADEVVRRAKELGVRVPERFDAVTA